MAAYIAVKPCSFAGVRYRIGDTIPDGAILPGAIRRLRTEGVIAEADAGLLLPASPSLEKEVEIPLVAKDEDIKLKMTVEELIKVVEIAQMNEDDIIAQLQSIEKEEQLILIDALAKSDAVFEAAKAIFDKQETEETEETVTGHLDPAQLETMSYNELKKLAKDMGLATDGKKEELIERIAAEEVIVEPDAVVAGEE